VNATERLMAKIEDIPTLPTVAMELTQMLDQPETETKDVQAVVRQDPSLSARLLKIVNSAYCGLPREVHDVAMAINILGFNAVKNVALSSFVFDFFGAEQSELDVKAFWMHSMACGVAVNEAARVASKSYTEDLFVFGLLHDLGRVIIWNFFPEEFKQIRATAVESRKSMTTAEREVLGMTHMEAGACLGKRWRFPALLTEALGHHHWPSDAPEESREIVSLVHVADLVCQCLELGTSAEVTVEFVDEQAFELLGLDQPRIGRLMDQTLTNLFNCGPMMSLLDIV